MLKKFPLPTLCLNCTNASTKGPDSKSLWHQELAIHNLLKLGGSLSHVSGQRFLQWFLSCKWLLQGRTAKMSKEDRRYVPNCATLQDGSQQLRWVARMR